MHLQDQGAYQRLIDYYVSYTEQHQKASELLDRESTNILAALDTAYRRVYDLAVEHLKRAYNAAKELGDNAALTKILLPLGLIMREWGECTQAEAYLPEGLALGREL